MDMISVILIKDGVIYQNKLFTGKSAVAKAEKHFRECVEMIIGSKVTEEDIIDMALDDGYYEGPECCVCISTPEVIKIK